MQKVGSDNVRATRKSNQCTRLKKNERTVREAGRMGPKKNERKCNNIRCHCWCSSRKLGQKKREKKDEGERVRALNSIFDPIFFLFCFFVDIVERCVGHEPSHCLLFWLVLIASFCLRQGWLYFYRVVAAFGLIANRHCIVQYGYIVHNSSFAFVFQLCPYSSSNSMNDIIMTINSWHHHK